MIQKVDEALGWRRTLVECQHCENRDRWIPCKVMGSTMNESVALADYIVHRGDGKL